MTTIRTIVKEGVKKCMAEITDTINPKNEISFKLRRPTPEDKVRYVGEKEITRLENEIIEFGETHIEFKGDIYTMKLMHTVNTQENNLKLAVVYNSYQPSLIIVDVIGEKKNG